MATPRRSSTPGHIRRRGPDTWQILLESAPDPLTGVRRRIGRTVHGSRRDAERVRAELVLDLGDGRAQAGSRSRLSDVIDRWLEHAEQRRRTPVL
jgi:integrase